MKLYLFGPAANSRRVQIFVTEKGLDIPVVEPNVREGALHEEPYRSMNPFSAVPFLELDDGTCVAESVAVCRYLEEHHPEPSLIGRDAKERAIIEMWNRRVEIDGFVPAIHAIRNADPLYAGRVLPGTRNDLPQVPEIVERGKDSLKILFERLEAPLADHPFIAGKTFSIADITGFLTVGIASRLDLPIPDTWPNLARWHADVSARPSTQS